jgi:hypothetical protein
VKLADILPADTSARVLTERIWREMADSQTLLHDLLLFAEDI